MTAKTNKGKGGGAKKIGKRTPMSYNNKHGYVSKSTKKVIGSHGHRSATPLARYHKQCEKSKVARRGL